MTYSMYFEWSQDERRTLDAAPSDLDADQYEAARVKAALLYAGASFMKIPPDGFRVVAPSGEEVYRYPEEMTQLRSADGAGRR